MGRPLRQETIELMNLTVSTKADDEVLKKQVGFNKYFTDKENVVKLSAELSEDYDAILELDNNGKKERVLKILRNIFQTEEGVYAYKLDEKDGIVFADANVTIAKPVAPDPDDGDGDETVTQTSAVTTSAKKASRKVTSTEVNE